MVMNVLFRLFTWIALSDVDWHFSLILVTKVNAVGEEIISAVWLHHQHNQAIHMTDGLTVTSLSASLQHKTRATKNHVGEIASNQILLHIIYAKLY
jgi:hypothetical protein